MILTLLKLATLPFGVLVLLYLLKDAVNFVIWWRQYRSQGIPLEYIPLIGMPYFFMVPFHKLFDKSGKLQKQLFGYIKNGDMAAKFRELAQRRDKDKIVALNGRLLAPSPLLVI